MMNLSEILENAHGGEAMQTMARQFGLSAEQTQAAVNALLPAFSIGLQKQAESAEALSNIVGMFGGGAHTPAFEEPEKAAAPDMLSAGSDFMKQIFGGSQEISQQIQANVAQQAAARTGVGANVLQQMMPMIASIIMGGLFKGAMNNGLGGLMGQATQGGLANIFGQAMGQPPQARNPMGELFGNMFGTAMGGVFGQPPKPQPTDPMAASVEVLKGMFQTGQAIHGQQMATLENIFSQVLNAQKK